MAQTWKDMPINTIAYENGRISIHGMTVRQAFAAISMMGMLANPNVGPNNPGAYAKDAVIAADALIDALNGESDEKKAT